MGHWARVDPALKAELERRGFSGPDFTSVNVITFDHSAFGKSFAPIDFAFPIPYTAIKDDSLLQAF
jgi:hypothetical protein